MPRIGNWRKTLFRLHGWIGLNLGLLLFAICFSGSVAVFSHEIDWLVDARHRVDAQDAPYDWTAMHEAVAESFPDGQNLGVYGPGSAYAPPGSGGAAVSYVALPNGQTRKVYLNPYTGALQGSTSFFNAQRFFRSFHRRFFDGNRGIVIVTLMAFPLLLSALSGWFFYKGWLKQMVTLRWDGGPRLRWSDLHKGAGIWGLAFTLLIALTGLFYFAELGFLTADNYDALLPDPLPQVEEASLDGIGPQPELLPASAYVASAKEAFPALSVHTVRMPDAPDDVVYVDGQAGNPVTRDRANKVHLHPLTGEVLGVQRSSDLGPAAFIADIADPLHFGYFGGFWTKVLWCALGLLLSFSILSGTYLWVVRMQPRQRRPASPGGNGQPFEDERGLGPVPMLRGAVVATALTLAYLGVVTVVTVQGIRGYVPQRGPEVAVATLDAGPYEIDLRCTSPCAPAEEATFVARFRGAGLPNLQAAALVGPGGVATELDGPARAPQASVTAAPGDTLQLRLTRHDGTVHTARFAAPPPATRPAPAQAWPDAAPGVWWVIGAFVAVTAGCIVGWLGLVVRAFRAKRWKLQRKAQRKESGPPEGVKLPPGMSQPTTS
ncbi:MAG: hypothetical protein GVY12_07000 [Bacteroidetes bacterium]|jgi:uncharacterized iron-regulated membrane protein|nr:hypothetical protein [Bacteroidota bacterium]